MYGLSVAWTGRHFEKCQEISIDSLAIFIGYPYEEREEFSQLCHQYGIRFYSFTVAPTSGKRISFCMRKEAGWVIFILYRRSRAGLPDAPKANVTKDGSVGKKVLT